MQEYQDFLQSKRIVVNAIGKDVDGTHPMLFPFQRDLVRWAARKGRAGIFADTGLGKTFMQVEWARLIGGRSLIVAPLSVARQTVGEAAKIDVPVHYTRSGDELAEGINITNYEMIEQFDPGDFDSVVLDECFVSDTPIDTVVGTRHICDIRPGDYVWTAAGHQKVRATHTRYAKSLVLTTIQGRDIISSENHLYLTHRGWVAARDLIEGDHVIYTTEAMRMVQEGISGEADKAGEPDKQHPGLLR